METILLFFCIFVMLIYLLWFVFGSRRWPKMLTLAVDVVLVLACVATLIFVLVLKTEEGGNDTPIAIENELAEPLVPETVEGTSLGVDMTATEEVTDMEKVIEEQGEEIPVEDSFGESNDSME